MYPAAENPHPGSNHWRRIRALALGLVLTLPAACGGGGDTTRVLDECTNNGQVLAVRTAMEDRYFWNDIPEQRDKYTGLITNSFDSPDDLLDFLRYRPDEFDRDFTHITTIEEDNQFFGPGIFVGYGFSFRFVAQGELRITAVFEGSPAEAAGFARGSQILSVDGQDFAAFDSAEQVRDMFGKRLLGVTQDFRLRDPDGDEFEVTVSKAEVTIDPVPQFKTIQHAGKIIGYVEFRTFISTSPGPISQIFAEFEVDGVTDVIIDLRYNGGGLVSVANFLASMLAGPNNVGKILSFTRHSQANGISNTTTTFGSETNSFNLDSVVFITSSGTASASELVINSLEPYMNVTLVGEQTFGKPVGQSAADFCDQRLRLVTFETLNVNEEGRYFDGLPVDCETEDKLELIPGDPAEEPMQAAVNYITSGSCGVIQTRTDARLQSADRPRTRPAGGNSAARNFAYAY